MTNDKSVEGAARSDGAGRRRRLAATAIRHKVRDLVGANGEAILEHDGQDYRLRITASGKLILTK